MGQDRARLVPLVDGGRLARGAKKVLTRIRGPVRHGPLVPAGRLELERYAAAVVARRAVSCGPELVDLHPCEELDATVGRLRGRHTRCALVRGGPCSEEVAAWLEGRKEVAR